MITKAFQKDAKINHLFGYPFGERYINLTTVITGKVKKQTLK